MGNILNTYREAHGLTYAALGAAAGYGPGTAYKHCKGTIAISGDAAIRYSRALGIPLEQLYPANSSSANADAFNTHPASTETPPAHMRQQRDAARQP